MTDTTSAHDFPHSATYSPEDDKLRIYPAHRLSAEDYAAAKAAGFRWAPMQELFFAVWSPAAEDVALDLAGEVDDEGMSLAERAEARAERFAGYSENRRRDSSAAHARADQLGERFHMGQPILVGHHSERGARSAQRKMHAAMDRAVTMWDRANYWTERAAGAVASAKYKEKPDVRHRRIKRLDSELRKLEKEAREERGELRKWETLDVTAPDALRKAMHLANYGGYGVSRCYPLADFPRDPPASQYEGPVSLWAAMDGGILTAEQARTIIMAARDRRAPNRQRWVDHLQNRLAYERAMLGEQGGVPADAFKLEVGGQVTAYGEWLTITRINRKHGKIVTVTTTPPSRFNWMQSASVPYEQITQYREPTPELKAAAKAPPLLNTRGDDAVEMTTAAYRRIHNDYKGTRTAEATAERGAYRYRVTMSGGKLLPVFLTDSKVHELPAPNGAAALPKGEPAPRKARAAKATPAPAATPEAEAMETMRETLRNGGPQVETTTARDFFPTPPNLAARLVELAGIKPGDVVLEPSAGGGNIAAAVLEAGGICHAVEENEPLCGHIRRRCPSAIVTCADFLQQGPADFAVQFDAVVMNPPFSGAADIRHIRHALQLLRPGGVLVAVCANGPRQRDALAAWADHWEDLPPGTFANAGTMVRTAVLRITKN